MPTQVALLRGINVVGCNVVSMAKLRVFIESLGHRHVCSLLQSGNLVFDTVSLRGTALETQLETESANQLKLTVDYFVRSANQWQSIIAKNPLRKEAERDPSHFLVLCLKRKPKPNAVRALQAAMTGGEIIRAVDRQLYMVYPNGIAKSKLNSSLIDQKLGISGTGRNWNTVLRIGAMIDDRSGK